MLIETLAPFFFIAVIFLAVTACIAKVIYIVTQPGQIFGGWQHVLNRMNDSNNRIAHFFFKPLGGCELCWAHMFGVFSFVTLLAFYTVAMHQWPPCMFGGLGADIIVNILFYLGYVCTSTVISTYAITRM